MPSICRLDSARNLRETFLSTLLPVLRDFSVPPDVRPAIMLQILLHSLAPAASSCTRVDLIAAVVEQHGSQACLEHVRQITEEAEASNSDSFSHALKAELLSHSWNSAAAVSDRTAPVPA